MLSRVTFSFRLGPFCVLYISFLFSFLLLCIYRFLCVHLGCLPQLQFFFVCFILILLNVRSSFQTTFALTLCVWKLSWFLSYQIWESVFCRFHPFLYCLKSWNWRRSCLDQKDQVQSLLEDCRLHHSNISSRAQSTHPRVSHSPGLGLLLQLSTTL